MVETSGTDSSAVLRKVCSRHGIRFRGPTRCSFGVCVFCSDVSENIDREEDTVHDTTHPLVSIDKQSEFLNSSI